MRFNGLTYFNRNSFSINEGEFPNIHVSWANGLLIYVAFSPLWKGYKQFWGKKNVSL